MVRVDFRGSGLVPAIGIVSRDMFGQPITCDGASYDGETVEEYVAPGTHFVWWRDANAARVGAAVRVEANRITNLNVAEGAPVPAPAGLGRAGVVIEGMDGAPLAEFEVTLEGTESVFGGSASGVTNARGRCEFEVVPGRYRIVAGDRELDVEIRAGKFVEAPIRPVQEGELVVRGAPEGTGIQLSPPEGSPRSELVADGAATFRFVRAGAYGLFAVISANGPRDVRPLGEVRIEPRRRVEVDAGLPRGSLDVRIRAAQIDPRGYPRLTLRAGLPSLTPATAEATAMLTSADGRDHEWVHTFLALTPGAYEIQVAHHGWKPVAQTVTIGEGRTRVELKLDRWRGNGSDMSRPGLVVP